MRSTASPPQFKILNSKFKIQNSNCKASPCLSFRASRGIFTMRNFVSPPSFFFFLSSFFFARLRLACVNGDGPFLHFILLRQVREHCMNFYCVNGDGPFLHFILLRQVREHCMNFYSHTANERNREGTETLP